jgi:hypothetical protein
MTIYSNAKPAAAIAVTLERSDLVNSVMEKIGTVYAVHHFLHYLLYLGDARLLYDTKNTWRIYEKSTARLIQYRDRHGALGSLLKVK